VSFFRQQYDRDYYEGIAYAGRPDSPRNENRLREVLAHKPGGRLLEIGCGKGAFLRLAERHFDVAGIDVSRYAVGCLKPYLGARVKVADVEQEELGADSYDVIAAFNVLEHLRKPGAVIHGIHRGLRGQGIVIGSVPNKSGPVGRVHSALTDLIDRTHCSTYPPHRWRALFREAGFTKIRFFGEIMLGRMWSTYVRHWLWPWVSLNLMFVCQR
jgi:2-polyprenyl-3-methyl-5-hydroxy-6-metoxy-1,4-benzoquinol methylase